MVPAPAHDRAQDPAAHRGDTGAGAGARGEDVGRGPSPADPDAGGRPVVPRKVRRWRFLPPPKVLLGILVVGALAYLVVRLRGDVASAWRRVSPDGLPWLVPAVAAELASFLCYAGVQRRLLSAGGAHLSLRTMAGLTAAATGLTNLVPGGTAPSSGWLVAQYRKRGIPLPLALWAVLAGGFAAAICVLALVVVGAGIADLVAPWEMVALLALLVGAALGAVALAHRLEAVRTWLAEERRIPFLGLARRIAGGVGDVGRFRATVPGGAVVYGLSLANWGLDVTVLGAAFAVLNLPVPWRSLLFAYAAAQVAGAISPLPGGIGFVEGGMIGAFALAGAGAGPAVVATVVYRLVTTLGMGAMGGVALLVVNRGSPRQAHLSGAAIGADRVRTDPQPDPG